MRQAEHASRFQRLLTLTKGNGLRAQLVRGGLGSVVVKLFGMGLSLAVVIVLARALGPEGYGVYAYVFALVSLLAIPAQFGLPALVVRETAKAQAGADWSALTGVWWWAGVVAGGLSLLLAVIGGLVAWLFTDRFTGAQLATFAWALVLVPGLVLSRLVGGGLRGLCHVVAGQLPDLVLRPGLLLAFVLVALGLHGAVTSSGTMALHALAAGLALLAGAVLLYRARPGESRGVTARYRHRAWAASALPLGFIAGMQVINTQADILMLGLFTDAEQVGIYRVAVQGAMLVAFGLAAVNMVVAPQFARMHAQDQRDQLQRLATASARAALAIAVPAVLVFVLFGPALLRTVVGSGYVSGATPLVILALGQLVNAGMGSVGVLLSMTDHERAFARGLALGAVFNVAANLVLIPLWGMNGAALATSMTFVIWNSLLASEVAKRLGINSTAFWRRQVLQ